MEKRLSISKLLTVVVVCLVAMSAQALERDSVSHRKYIKLFLPNQIVLQTAGNMGVIEGGPSWSYGKNKQWESQFLIGFVPKFHSDVARATFTIKQNFQPWQLSLGKGFTFAPLRTGVYVTAITGEQFWNKQAGRYPANYYENFSSKIRFSIFVGESFTYRIPRNEHKLIKSITGFYELSTCDWYIRDIVVYNGISLGDIIGLSLGVNINL